MTAASWVPPAVVHCQVAFHVERWSSWEAAWPNCSSVALGSLTPLLVGHVSTARCGVVLGLSVPTSKSGGAANGVGT